MGPTHKTLFDNPVLAAKLEKKFRELLEERRDRIPEDWVHLCPYPDCDVRVRPSDGLFCKAHGGKAGDEP